MKKIIIILVVLLIIGAGFYIYKNSNATISDDKAFEKVEKVYSELAEATDKWMEEEGCTNDIQICFDKMKKEKTLSPDGFSGIAKYLDIVDSSYYIVNDDSVLNQDIKNLKWLPNISTLYDGTKQEYAWQSVSKITTGVPTGNINATGLYLLADGTTLSIQMPDDLSNSGFGFFDINGKKSPNKVGVDIYPVGWGIPYMTQEQKEDNFKLYGEKAKGFNPYYVEDNSDIFGGLCVVGNDKSFCSDDEKNNPTAYILKHKKIPNK